MAQEAGARTLMRQHRPGFRMPRRVRVSLLHVLTDLKKMDGIEPSGDGFFRFCQTQGKLGEAAVMRPWAVWPLVTCERGSRARGAWVLGPCGKVLGSCCTWGAIPASRGVPRTTGLSHRKLATPYGLASLLLRRSPPHPFVSERSSCPSPVGIWWPWLSLRRQSRGVPILRLTHTLPPSSVRILPSSLCVVAEEAVP